MKSKIHARVRNVFDGLGLGGGVQEVGGRSWEVGGLGLSRSGLHRRSDLLCRLLTANRQLIHRHRLVHHDNPPHGWRICTARALPLRPGSPTCAGTSPAYSTTPLEAGRRRRTTSPAFMPSTSVSGISIEPTSARRAMSTSPTASCMSAALFSSIRAGP